MADLSLLVVVDCWSWCWSWSWSWREWLGGRENNPKVIVLQQCHAYDLCPWEAAGRQAALWGYQGRRKGISERQSLRKSYMMALRGWKVRDLDLVRNTVAAFSEW